MRVPIDIRARIHGFTISRDANGPGLRAVVWFQGCSLACAGCFNPGTHPLTGGRDEGVADLADRILSSSPALEGITLTGGEPWQQPRACRALVEIVRASTSLSVITFTGFEFPRLALLVGERWLRENIDVVIAGPYDDARRVARGLVGSSNKSVHHLSPRYRPEDLASVPVAEVLIEPDGRVISTGIDPVRIARA